ncbi:MAG: DNA alkylation repair protein [Syntrophothermus sp.]
MRSPSSKTSGEAAAARLEKALRAAGDPVRAEGERRYLKSELTHFGVRVPEVRRLAGRFAAEAGGRDELWALTSGLWRRRVHECRLAAAMALQARAELVAEPDLPRIREMVREARTWAIVDVLAVRVLGALLVAHPGASAELDVWAEDPDLWVRRAALLAQIEPLQAGAPLERFGGYADAMLAEREPFIAKAIGWVLRETGKVRPDEVYEWLLPRAGRASGVTIREAVKYLSPSQHDSILRARPPTSHQRRTDARSAVDY